MGIRFALGETPAFYTNQLDVDIRDIFMAGLDPAILSDSGVCGDRRIKSGDNGERIFASPLRLS